FELVVMKCLEKPVDERFQDVGALAKALEPFAPAEALPSIERIMRVLQAATTGGQRRTRTVRTSPQPESSAPVAPLSQVEAAQTAPEPTPTVTVAPSPTLVATPEPSASVAPSAKVVPIKGPIAAPSAKTSASTKPSAKPNCDPPYVIDGDGNKKYKMECL